MLKYPILLLLITATYTSSVLGEEPEDFSIRQLLESGLTAHLPPHQFLSNSTLLPSELSPIEIKPNVMLPPVLGSHSYVDSKTLILIYKNYRKFSSDQSLTDIVTTEEIDILRTEIDKSREFIWRHSHFKFNMQVTDFIVVDRELTLDQYSEVSQGAYWLSYNSVDGHHSISKDMADLNLIGRGYDSIIILYAWKNTENARAAYGGATFGVGTLDGASYIAIPLEWGIKNKRGVIVHEYLHFLDSLFDAAGESEFPHADQPTMYTGDYNYGWEWLAWMLETWPLEKWLNTGVYATIRQVPDADNDGLPDFGVDGTNVPLAVTEKFFGSLPSKNDSDDDDLKDQEEVLADIFTSSNPLNPDTDNDGLMDGKDLYPIFPIKDKLLKQTPIVDGVIDDQEHLFLAKVIDNTGADFSGELFFEWDDNYLYISAKVKDDHVDGFFTEPWWNDHLHIKIDAMNDGYEWHGNDNLEIYIGPKGADNGEPFVHPQIRNADGTIDTLTIKKTDLIYHVKTTSDGYEMELAIPSIPSIGLIPKKDYTLGISASFVDFDGEFGWSWVEYDAISGRLAPELAFIDLTLTEKSVIDSDGDGIPDTLDSCKNSILNATVIIKNCDSKVSNSLDENGCTISDKIDSCSKGSKNTGQYISCIAKLTRTLKKDHLINWREKYSIFRCATKLKLLFE